MRFTEEKAAEVKQWVVKKLEDISDADSDVLADYVLALIRTDAPDEDIKKASIENLEDFLKENTVSFVSEIFETFSPKPEAPEPSLQPPNQPQAEKHQLPNIPPQSAYNQAPYNAPLGPSQGAQNGHNSTGYNPRGGFDGANYSRKRAYHDGPQAGDGQDSHYNNGDRSFKNPRTRRGGGRGDRMGGGSRDNRGLNPASANFVPGQQQPGAFPGLMPGPPGFPPFDPNDPMAAMMALQSMGFPQMPGVSPVPSMPNQGGSGVPHPGSPPARIPQRCRDYDTKGFCALGTMCPYEHGPDQVVGSFNQDEYDPANAMMSDVQNGHSSRGHERGRGRGRGRGDRGGFGRGRGGRAEFSQAGPNEDKSITTIVVEQIPEDKFSEQAVRDFFSEFGDIVEVTLKPYKHLALVKYDSYPAARRAWASPKVIFDNRFVKVYWYKPSPKGDGSGSHTPSGESRAESTPFDKEEFEKQQAAAQKSYEDKLQKRKEAEEARQALEKQREELLKKQQEEKTKLLQKLGQPSADESGEAKDPEKGADDENVSDQTKSLRAQLAALEAEAKILGIDPSNTDPAGRGRGRGSGGYRGRGAFPPRGRGYDPSFRGGWRGRGAPRGRGGVLRLDNRPKRVAISGVHFDSDKDEALRQYLIGIGEFESIDPNPDASDSQIVTFKDRYMAEKLMFGSSDIPSVGKVEFTWVANPAPATASTTAQAFKKDDDDSTMSNTAESDMRKDVSHEVDYDVAEVDDSWDMS